ncbi:MAG: type II toxin-antitoxin system VapC family toxin [archaeon]
MVYLDTDILINLLRGGKSAVKILKELEEKGERIKTTSINSLELYKGCYKSKETEENLKTVRRMLENIEIHDFKEEDSEFAAKILNELREKGEKIGEFDSIISSIILNNNDYLITRNQKHFSKIPHLEIQEW